MLVMIAEGRLGNQVFQYLALRASARPGELVVMLGCEDLTQAFEGVRACVIPIDQGPFRHLRSLDRRKFARRMRAARLGGLLGEAQDGSPVRDSLRGLVLCDRAWFQTPSALAEPSLKRLRIRAGWIDAAREAWRGHGLDPLRTVVVHARGGDYRSWPSPASPAIVPAMWFARQVTSLRMGAEVSGVLVMGDDPEYSRQVQAALPGSSIHHLPGPGAQARDLAMLSMCPRLVISPSTFGFWGAWFSSKDHADAHVIAPRFWAGHRTSTWFPPFLEATFIDYRECLPLDYEAAAR